MSRSPSHNFGLDVVRAAAILSVLFAHTADWFLGPGRDTDIDAFYFGAAGVEVFFSLSGFLIGGILLRTIDRGFTLRQLGRFWSRRWMRTLPAYWVVLGGLSAWFGVWNWPGLVFLQTFQPPPDWTPLTPHTWSLVLEEWFYLFVPPLILVASRLLPAARARWSVPLVCLGLVVGCIALRTLAILHPDPAFWGTDREINPILRLDCASWGLLAAWFGGRVPLRRPAAVAWLTAGLVLLVALGLLSRLTFTPERLVPYGIVHWATAWNATRNAWVEFAAMATLLGLSALWPRARGPGAHLVRGIAVLSYALYLVHIPVLFLGRMAGLDDTASWANRAVLAALVVVAALVLRYGVERPALALRDRLVPDRAAAVRGVPISTPPKSRV